MFGQVSQELVEISQQEHLRAAARARSAHEARAVARLHRPRRRVRVALSGLWQG